jgi:signal transduction histidine kinase
MEKLLLTSPSRGGYSWNGNGAGREAVLSPHRIRVTKARRRKAKGSRTNESEQFRHQLRCILEQANCLLWQADIREIYPDGGVHMPFDPVKGTLLTWNIRVVNQSESEVPSWLPVARGEGETVTQAWVRSRIPEDEIQADNIAQQAIWTEQPRYTQTFRNRMADGSLRWMLEDVHIEEFPPVLESVPDTVPLAEGEDRKQWMRRWRLVGVVTDITERKQAEERQQALTEALKQVTERANCLLWRAIVREDSPTPKTARISDTGRQTALIWDLEVVNEAEVLHWLPIERREDESFVSAWNRARHPGDFQECRVRSRATMAAGLDRYTQVFRTQVVGGSIHWLQEDVRVEEIEPQLETMGSGQRLRQWRLVGVVTDVTERKLAEERQQALAEDLRRSNSALQEFAYVASHDLKEPLRKIQSFGNLLKHRAGTELSGEASGYLDRMITGAGRMQNLIQALLQYSRVAGKVGEIMPVNLNEIMAGVLSDLETRIEEVGGSITIEEMPTIPADPVQMRQLFQNLLVNALKFHRPEIAPVVQVTVKQAESWVTLRFIDNGIGFAPEYAERIFLIFERLAGRANAEGSGVGLAICKRIVEHHGGSITAESCPDAGSVFIVRLPL